MPECGYVTPIDVRTNGIEFEVRTPDGGQQLGDLILTKTRLEWCQGRTRRGHGARKTWQQFIDWMNQ